MLERLKQVLIALTEIQLDHYFTKLTLGHLCERQHSNSIFRHTKTWLSPPAAWRLNSSIPSCGVGSVANDHASHPIVYFLFWFSSSPIDGRIRSISPYPRFGPFSSFPAPNMAQVKQEPYIKQEYIKQDPDSKDTVLADIDEEDLYEDAGDLDFTSAGQSVWLSRLPRQLWEHWAHLDDDEEIEIGTMRVEGTPDDIKRVSESLCTCSFSDGV